MTPQGREQRLGYLFAVVAALAYGTNAVINRAGLKRYGSPLVAIVIALVTGVLVLAPLAYRAYRASGAGWRPERRALLFILFSGLSAIIGYGMNVYALSVLPVVIVAPISASYPLVTVVLARIFLKGQEPVSSRMIGGVALVVAGVLVVTLAH